jgi:hypothetical protein
MLVESGSVAWKSMWDLWWKSGTGRLFSWYVCYVLPVIIMPVLTTHLSSLSSLCQCLLLIYHHPHYASAYYSSIITLIIMPVLTTHQSSPSSSGVCIITYSVKQSFLRIIKKFSTFYGNKACSLEPVTEPCPEPVQSDCYPDTLFI